MKHSLLFIISLFALVFSSCAKEDINSNNSTHSTGAIESDLSNDTFLEMPLGGSSSFSGNGVDLSPNMPHVNNQGKQQACVGFTLAYLKSYQEAKESGSFNYSSNNVFSPSFIFNSLTKVSDCSLGITAKSALILLRNTGASPIGEFPLTPYDCSLKPSQSIVNSAYKYKIKEWGPLKTGSKDFLTNVKYFLQQKQPIVAGIKVKKDFKTLKWNGRTEMIYYGVNSYFVNDFHCVLVVGYDDNKSSVKIINSWGTDWGNEGYMWIDYTSFLDIIKEAYVTWDEVTPQSGSSGSTDQAIIQTNNLNLGDIKVGTTTPFLITFKNTGTKDLVVINITIDNSMFKINGSTNKTVGAGKSGTISGNFTPTSKGSINAVVTINSNASNGTSKKFTITAYGI